MQILILTQWFQPEPFFKGLPLAKALKNKGHQVEVITGFPNYPDGNVYPGYKLKLYQKECMNGIKIHRLFLYPSHDSSGLKRILNYLSFGLAAFVFGPFKVRKPQLIYVYNLVTLMPLAVLLRAVFHCKIFLDIQDLWPDSILASKILKNTEIIRKCKKIFNYAYRLSDFIIVQSDGFRRELISRGIHRKKIKVIPNWTEEYPKSKNKKQYQKRKKKKLFTVLYAGAIGFVQNLDIVLECAKLFQNEKRKVLFKIMGNGPDKKNLIKKAKCLKLKNVKFPKPKKPFEMNRVYNSADLLLVHLRKNPLFKITIPSKTQAYLYAGRPILAALEGDASNLVKHSRAGIACEPENAKAMVKSILKIQRLPYYKRLKMGLYGQKYYQKNLSFLHGIESINKNMYKLLKDKSIQ